MRHIGVALGTASHKAMRQSGITTEYGTPFACLSGISCLTFIDCAHCRQGSAPTPLSRFEFEQIKDLSLVTSKVLVDGLVEGVESGRVCSLELLA